MSAEDTRENIYKKPPLGIGPGGRTYRAIIIDDSKTARQMLKQILLSVKFDVISEFENGGAALSALSNPGVQVEYLFIDVEMPVMGGIDLVKSIRERLRNCKIIMVTSHSDREKVEELVKLGVNGYIKKPFDRDTVLFKLEQLR
jgi:YesN/AraC family two-component response regulator